jgi:hypothetical protein
LAAHSASAAKLFITHPWNQPDTAESPLSTAEVRQCMVMARCAPMLHLRLIALFYLHRG